MGIAPGGEGYEAYRATLARDFPALAARSFAYLGEGGDHIAFEIGAELVIRFAKRGNQSALDREARILRHVAAISPLPTPVPVVAHAGGGYLGYRKLSGVPLLGAVGGFDPRGWPDFAATLGAFLSAINSAPVAPFGDALLADTPSLEEWREEARATFARLRHGLSHPVAGRIADVFAAAPPNAPFTPAFAHTDLGMEHILVDLAARRVTGIIDWGDAALADPARDFGKLYRDLGVGMLDAVLDHYTAGDDSAALRTRAIFYARCGALEDLEYGHATGREEYAAKSLAALPRLFP